MISRTFICGPEADKREVTFSVPEDPGKNLLAAISGGVDSAVMLYVLAQMNKEHQLQHKIFPVTVTNTVSETDESLLHARKVIKWVSAELDVAFEQHIIGGDNRLPHNKITNSFLLAQMATRKFQHLYVAENKIPPIPFPFGDKNDFPGLAPRLAPVRKGNPTGNAAGILPFSDVFKTHIVDLYFQLGITELLEFTHSCAERQVGKCHLCWWCSERQWAFRELNKIDPGAA